MSLAANYPEILNEKSLLKQLQKLSDTPASVLMKELRPLLVKLLKTLRDRYKEEEPKHLGGGAFGQIFEVKPLNSNLSLALKVQLNQADETINQMEQEAAIAKRVHQLLMEEFHSGTIPLFDSLQFISEGEVLFICQEMGVEDASLEREVEQRYKEGRPYTYFHMMKICNEICHCLLKMHTNHIAHLDLKPGNVLYSKKIDKYIVIDFGVSEDHSEDMQTSKTSIEDFSSPSYACTPSYASPLARKSSDMLGDAIGDHNPFKSDLFSAGLIMLELCAMLPNFSSLPLNRDKGVLTRALDTFLNFSGQHLFLEKEEDFHVVLELQAMLE